MTLNANLMIAPSLEEYHVDKLTGLPLAAGKVYFWQDAAHTVPQPVYQLSGSPPNYTYTQLPNPMTLSSIGTFVDGSGNDIKIYYFPFTGTPSSPGGAVSLYYIEVYNSGGQLQWARQAWPNFTQSSAGSGVSIVDFIPNGQFIAHTNIPAQPNATPVTVAGQITQAITVIAQGGWTFERPSGSTAKDIVTYSRSPSSFTGSLPTGSPRYAVTVQNTVTSSGDAFKDVRIKFSDVNKFSSTIQQYTLYFEAQNNGGGTIQINALARKFFGAGGSSPVETAIGTFNIGSSYQQNIVAFNFGTNQGYTLGTGDDDYIQICFRFPVNVTFSATCSNFILALGSLAFPSPPTGQGYPYVTTADYMARAIAGWLPTPDYNSQNIYLPIKLGPNGLTYDTAVIGDVVYESGLNNYVNSLSTVTNRMLPNGSKYKNADYSLPLGIPFSRLGAYYMSIGNNQIPAYGTGADYFTAVSMGNYASTANQLVITNNSSGAVTNTADGTVATGFTFNTIHTGANYNAQSYMVSSGGVGIGTFYLQDTINGVVIDTAVDGAGGLASGFTIAVVQTGTSILPQITSFIAPVNSSALAGKYFNWSNTTTKYYVWFKVGSSGTDPNPPGSRTGILVILDASETEGSIAEKVREALNGWQQTTINTTAASAVTQSSYFLVNSTAANYYVWYNVDGGGTDPKPTSFGIQVNISATGVDTAATVALKTQLAINSYSYAVPDYRGLFLRNVNNGSTNDLDALFRFSLVPGIQGDRVGTSQLSQNLSHAHAFAGLPLNLYAGGGGQTSYQTDPPHQSNTLYSGGTQSNPNNISVNMAIIY